MKQLCTSGTLTQNEPSIWVEPRLSISCCISQPQDQPVYSYTGRAQNNMRPPANFLAIKQMGRANTRSIGHSVRVFFHDLKAIAILSTYLGLLSKPAKARFSDSRPCRPSTKTHACAYYTADILFNAQNATPIIATTPL